MHSVRFMAFVCLLISGCANFQQPQQDVVRSKVTTFHNLPTGGENLGTISIIQGKGFSNGLEFQNYASKIEGYLTSNGFSKADSHSSAEFVGIFSYAIDNGRTQISSRPIYGPVAPGYNYTTGSVYPAGYPNAASVSSSTISVPVMGITGAATESSVYYTRTASLIIMNRETEVTIWEGRVISYGLNGEISVVLPVMISALLQNFPGPSGVTRDIEQPMY